MDTALAFLCAYLCGSIPFGLLLGFLAGRDIRTAGSGNIGATNTLRVCGALYGVPALALDIFKGVAPVLFVTPTICENPSALLLIGTGLLAILGHNFPVWLKFKGGKGVATSAGVVGALMWQPLAIALAVFFAVVLLTRYISLGSMLASVALVISQICLHGVNSFGQEQLPLTVTAMLLCVMVIARHRSNISRLLAGTESKIFAGNISPPEEKS